MFHTLNNIRQTIFKLCFNLWRERKGYLNLPCLVWQGNCPLNLITGCATLGCKNCNQAFAITANESFALLGRNFGPLFVIVLLHNSNVLALQGMNWWPDIILQDFLVESRIHTVPDHHTTTTLSVCWYDATFIFTQKVTELKQSNIPQDIFPTLTQVFEIIRAFLANLRRPLPSLFLIVKSLTLTFYTESDFFLPIINQIIIFFV